MQAKLRRWLPVPLVVLALTAAGLAAGGSGLTVGRLPPPEPTEVPGETREPPATAVATPPASPVAEEPPPGPEYVLPAWFENLVTGLLLAVALACVGLFLYVGGRWLFTERVLRHTITDQPASQPGGAAAAEVEQVRDALRAGLFEIDAGGDPRRAVIACWLRLERVAAAAGTPRHPAETPADLVVRLLAAYRISDRALTRLADAYRLARYAPTEIHDDLVETARQALREVDIQLVAAVPAARPAAPEPVR